MIVEERPDAIVCIGDWSSFDSLSTYEAPGTKKNIELPDLKADIDAGRRALGRLCAPLRRLQEKAGRRGYRPLKIMCEGNHEERFKRVVNKYPKWATSLLDPWELMGFYDPAVVGRDPWEIYEFKTIVNVDGIDYTHVPHGNNGKPMTGVFAPRKVAQNSGSHTVFGHTHNFGVYNLPVVGAENGVRSCINIASFLPHQHVESYASGCATGWQYMVARVWPSGDPLVAPDVETVQVWRLQEMYG